MTPMFDTTNLLAMDIGGANLKACFRDEKGVLHGISRHFVMCQQIGDLVEALSDFVLDCPVQPDGFLITMTGELCDCFTDRRQGVEQILHAVRVIADNRPVYVWSTTGQFVTIDQACEIPMSAASANWHALATWIGLNHQNERILLLDTGTTTTDLIPICNGIVATSGLTDADRLTHGELIYLGASVTPLMVLHDALVGVPMCSEWFANMHDVGLILGYYQPQPDYHDTPDGMPRTFDASARRLMRMLGRDLTDNCTVMDVCQIAQRFCDGLVARLGKGIQTIIQQHHPIQTLVVTGSGSWLLDLAIKDLSLDKKVISLDEIWGDELSYGACATALIKLFECKYAHKKTNLSD